MTLAALPLPVAPLRYEVAAAEPLLVESLLSVRRRGGSVLGAMSSSSDVFLYAVGLKVVSLAEAASTTLYWLLLPALVFLNRLANFDLQSEMEDFLFSLNAISFKLMLSGSIRLQNKRRGGE